MMNAIQLELLMGFWVLGFWVLGAPVSGQGGQAGLARINDRVVGEFIAFVGLLGSLGLVGY
jgi:hypothetical protein